MLRGHVHETAEYHAGLGGPVRLGDFGNAEVGDEGPPGFALQHEVVGFDIAVDDAARVRVSEGPRYFADDAAGLRFREWTVTLHMSAHALAVDESHLVPNETVTFTHVVNRNDVWVAQAAGKLGLTGKARSEVFAVRQFGWEDLYRDVALQSQIGGAVHDAHATASDLGSQFELRSERFGQFLAQLNIHDLRMDRGEPDCKELLCRRGGGGGGRGEPRERHRRGRHPSVLWGRGLRIQPRGATAWPVSTASRS